MSRPVQSVTLNDSRNLPVVAFGTGTALYNKDSSGAVLQALKAGYTHLDCAESYDNEQATGEAIKQSGLARSSLWITTKCGSVRQGADASSSKDTESFSPRKSLTASLKKLQLDYVDLFLLHAPWVCSDLPAAWRVMEELQEEGLARSIGVSNFTAEDLQEILDSCTIYPAVNQIEFHPHVLPSLQPVIELCHARQIMLACYSPLASITKRPGTKLDAVVKEIADERDETIAQVLLTWARAESGGYVLTTSSSVDRLKEQIVPFSEGAQPLSLKQRRKISQTAALEPFRVFEQFMGQRERPAAASQKMPLSQKKDDFSDLLLQLEAEAEGDGNHIETSEAWPRPPLPHIDPRKDAIVYQQIDIEDTIDPVLGPTVRLFGVTPNGNSMLAHVHGFRPYFFVAAPSGFMNADLPAFKDALNASVSSPTPAVHSCIIETRKSLWGYKGDESVPFIKITCTEQKNLPKVRGAFERAQIDFQGLFPQETLTYESNIEYTLRFMIDTKVVGMNWIEIPKGEYKRLEGSDKKSKTQLEVTCHYRALRSHAPEGDWAAIAPLRILSFDIECAGRKGIFPEAHIDPVIQIANMVTRQGESKPFIRNVFTLNTCANIAGAQVLEHTSEKAMLQAWSDFVGIADPDVVIGYNIGSFDLPYLIDRAKALKCSDFHYLGRLNGIPSTLKETHFQSKAMGGRTFKELNMDGRLQFDLFTVIQRDYKLRSYTLNSVCAQFLGEQKEDVHFSIITELQNGTAESRRRLAVYCLKDAYLPQRLMDKLMCFINYTEMSRVTGVPFNYLLTRGQQIKVISQLYRKAGEDKYVIPAMKSEGSDEQYEGATVIEPIKGYYDVPISTLDFASLYPSIMMAHNLCYTTLLDKQTIDRLKLVEGQDYIHTPNNDFFATTGRRKGLLPTVLEDLLSARKRAKNDLKVEKDPFKRAVLDGRQLALKISANSVYGFTGATVGKLPCLAISSSVTAYGRQMIHKTQELVEKEYCIENGYDYNAQVVYGDTDSVMVKFGCPDLETAMRLGAEAADLVSKEFIKPIKLEFEKVYFPYLLINKKRYAGLYWTRPDKWDKMDTKGLETVRRDNCQLASDLISTCLHKLLIDRDAKGAEEYAKKTIADLLQNKVDMTQLVITKQLMKEEDDTKEPTGNKQAHTELAARMRIRDPGSAPVLGDRVPYVFIKGPKGARAFEKSEDPLYVLEHSIPIDTKHYLETQLSNPLMRIFEPILGEKAGRLLAGDHTRTISIVTPTVGGLMKFAVKKVTCMGCRTPLNKNKAGKYGAVCINCRPKLSELYQKQIDHTSEMEVDFARLWTQCQRCQGSLHQDVICTSKDCPIFYRRTARQKDVMAASTLMDRFHEEEGW